MSDQLQILRVKVCMCSSFFLPVFKFLPVCAHTFATNFLIYNCGDVFRLQQILGHTTLDMVRRYVHYASAHILIQSSVASPIDRMGIKGLRSYRIDKELGNNGWMKKG